MIRPFTILYLADLHIGQNEKAELIFTKLQERIAREFTENNPQAKPDFLVIAGDIIDSSKDVTKYKEKYEKAGKAIDTLIDRFSIEPDHVIVVPGNHDKCSVERTDYCAIDEFNKFYNKTTHEIKDNARWKNLFKRLFEGYASFYSRYLKEGTKDKSNEPSYLGDKELFETINNGIKHGSGLVSFKSLNVCFLLINTEWTYNPDGDYFDDQVRLIPDLICKPLQEYYSKYMGYSLITVMHRSPLDLSWKEQHSGGRDSRILMDIIEASDLIVSGHMHGENFMPPHMMGNHAQLINLGSISHGNNDVEHLRASLMVVDQLNAEFSLRNFEMNMKTFKWKEKNTPVSYPLFNKFPHKDTSQMCTYGPLRTFSKSSNEEDIEDSIKHLYDGRNILYGKIYKKDKVLESLINYRGNLIILSFCINEKTTGVIDLLNELFSNPNTGKQHKVILIIYALKDPLSKKAYQDEKVLLERMSKRYNELKVKIIENNILLKEYIESRLIIQDVLIECPLRWRNQN